MVCRTSPVPNWQTLPFDMREDVWTSSTLRIGIAANMLWFETLSCASSEVDTQEEERQFALRDLPFQLGDRAGPNGARVGRVELIQDVGYSEPAVRWSQTFDFRLSLLGNCRTERGSTYLVLDPPLARCPSIWCGPFEPEAVRRASHLLHLNLQMPRILHEPVPMGKEPMELAALLSSGGYVAEVTARYSGNPDDDEEGDFSPDFADCVFEAAPWCRPARRGLLHALGVVYVVVDPKLDGCGRIFSALDAKPVPWRRHVDAARARVGDLPIPDELNEWLSSGRWAIERLFPEGVPTFGWERPLARLFDLEEMRRFAKEIAKSSETYRNEIGFGDRPGMLDPRDVVVLGVNDDGRMLALDYGCDPPRVVVSRKKPQNLIWVELAADLTDLLR